VPAAVCTRGAHHFQGRSAATVISSLTLPSLQHAACNMQPATCSLQHAACNMQPATFRRLPSGMHTRASPKFCLHQLLLPTLQQSTSGRFCEDPTQFFQKASGASVLPLERSSSGTEALMCQLCNTACHSCCSFTSSSPLLPSLLPVQCFLPS
jgi:hypothetical protein